MSNVLVIQNPLWKEEAEQGEAAYGVDLDYKVGVFDKGAETSALRLSTLLIAIPILTFFFLTESCLC